MIGYLTCPLVMQSSGVDTTVDTSSPPMVALRHACNENNCETKRLHWNLVIKRSDITKPSYSKVILLVPALYICFFTLI